MHNSRTKRVNFSLHLRPDDSQADQRAFSELRQWHEGLKQSGRSREDMAMEMRGFHRHVYLAGLQLQRLSPRACGHIAESIGRDSLTLPELMDELSAGGLLPEGTPTRAAASEHFSEQQLEQLQLLLETVKPAPAKKTSRAEKDNAAELARLREEIEKMNHLLEQQNSQLQQLRRGEPGAAPVEASRGGSEEVALSEVAASAEKMKKIRQKGIF
jgi:hypothetical protein